MILYVGEKSKSYFAEEVVKTFGEAMEYTGYKAHINELKEYMTKEKYSHIIIDCEQFIDDFNTITFELENIRTVTNSNIIIVAIGYSLQSELVQSLAFKGFRNFVVDVILSKQKEQLKHSLENINSVLDIMPKTKPDEEPHQVVGIVNNTQNHVRTIAFVGSSQRIGTTTHSFQYIKYLQYMNKKACYIEANNKQLVKNISQIFSVPYSDEELGKLSYMNIDMFDKTESLEQILKLPYDYFIYDYGDLGGKAFNFFSFIEKDVKVCVCGAKADEIVHTNNLIGKTYNNDVFYLFNFTDESERKDILDLMNKKAEKTMFSLYCPDYFSYKSSSNTLYEKINLIRKEQPQKKGLFSKLRKDRY